MDKDERYLSVKEASIRFGISAWTIYELIKTDPSFPYRNIGLRRKFVIVADEFDAWLKERTRREKSLEMRIPTADELLNLQKKNSQAT